MAENGGDAIYTTYPITLINNGVIGGGGGGGGSALSAQPTYGGYAAGGGGGAGRNIGSGGYAVSLQQADGADGTLTTGGAGGTVSTLVGGDGGDLGEDGGNASGGAVNTLGGSAGKAINGASYATIESASSGTFHGEYAALTTVVLNNVYTMTNAAVDTGWADLTSTPITLPAGVRRLYVNAKAYGCTAEAYDVYTEDKEPVYDHTETAWYQATFNMKLQYYTDGAWVTISETAPVTPGSAPKVLLNFLFDTGIIATDITEYKLVFDYVSDYYDTDDYIVQEDVTGTYEYLKEVSYTYATS